MPASAASEYALEIIKSKRILLVKKGAKIEKRFFISGGRGGSGDKTRIGDRKTPIGHYRIIEFNDKSTFHYFMHLNYPNVKDAFWGLKNRYISRRDFDRIVRAHKRNEMPPQDTRLGGYIGIHGIGDMTTERLRIHDNFDWTKGCIALTNGEINDLKHYVKLGTKVVIYE